MVPAVCTFDYDEDSLSVETYSTILKGMDYKCNDINWRNEDWLGSL